MKGAMTMKIRITDLMDSFSDNEVNLKPRTDISPEKIEEMVNMKIKNNETQTTDTEKTEHTEQISNAVELKRSHNIKRTLSIVATAAGFILIFAVLFKTLNGNDVKPPSNSQTDVTTITTTADSSVTTSTSETTQATTTSSEPYVMHDKRVEISDSARNKTLAAEDNYNGSKINFDTVEKFLTGLAEKKAYEPRESAWICTYDLTESFKNVEFDYFEITDWGLDYADSSKYKTMYYDITMHVKSSTDSRFPAGVSEWRLWDGDMVASAIGSFTLKDKKSSFDSYSNLSGNALLAFNFTFTNSFGNIKSVPDVSKLESYYTGGKESNFVSSCRLMLNYYSSTCPEYIEEHVATIRNENPSKTYTDEEAWAEYIKKYEEDYNSFDLMLPSMNKFEVFLEKCYGIKNIDWSKYEEYIPESEDNIYHTPHRGRGWYYFDVTKNDRFRRLKSRRFIGAKRNSLTPVPSRP